MECTQHIEFSVVLKGLVKLSLAVTQMGVNLELVDQKTEICGESWVFCFALSLPPCSVSISPAHMERANINWPLFYFKLNSHLQ